MSKAFSVILIVLVGVIFYGLTMRGYVGNYTTVKQLKSIANTSQPFESSHERASYAEMLTLRAKNSVELAPDMRDFAAPDVGYKGDKYYSYFPPGMSLFIRPFFELGYPLGLSLVFVYGSISLLALFTMIMIYLICHDIFSMPSYACVAAAILFAFTSTSWSYAITIYQHIPAAFFATLMFYGVWKYRARAKSGALWASLVWFIYGISILFDYPNGLLLLPFIVYYVLSALESPRDENKLKLSVNTAHVGVAIWFLIAVSIHILFNLIFMSSWHELRQVYDRYDPNLTKKITSQQAVKRLDTVTSENVPKPVADRMGYPFVEEFFINGLVTLLVAPDKGIFYFSPIFLFSLLGIYIAYSKHRSLEHYTLGAFIVINVILYASFSDPYGGWAFGPRYLIPCMTALSIYAAYGLSKIRSELVKIVFYVLFLFSMCISAAGALTSNKVPPQIEASFLKLKYYNYLLNFHLLDDQRTGSFVYNTYLTKYLNLSDLYVLIVICLGLLMFVLLFVVPLLNRPRK